MRVSQSEKDKSHQRIIEAASQLIRENGIEGASVNEVMQAAGLTNGGFYRHFSTKEDLIIAAIDHAFKEITSLIEDTYEEYGVKEGSEKYFKQYLSDGHVKHPAVGCPITSLCVDVARSSLSIKKSFADGFMKAVAKISKSGRRSKEENTSSAIRKLAMLAGAVMIARATDTATSNEVLNACREK